MICARQLGLFLSADGKFTDIQTRNILILMLSLLAEKLQMSKSQSNLFDLGLKTKINVSFCSFKEGWNLLALLFLTFMVVVKHIRLVMRKSSSW